MKSAKPSNPPAPDTPVPDRRVRVVSIGRLKPLTAEDQRRMREAARDPQLSAGRRFPTIKD